MQDIFHHLLVSGPFIPHGHCYLWKPGLVWLHLISDTVIALAYYSIPLTLFYFVRKRQDLPFHWIFLWFAAFIVACGTTHLMEIWTLWHPTYWVAGTLKALTALISLLTAFQLVSLVPLALALPSPAQLKQANEELQAQVKERLRVEAELRLSQNQLEQRVQERTAELVTANAQLQQEVHDRQQAEAALRTSAERLSLALRAAQMGDWSWEAATDMVTFSDRAAEIFGIPSGPYLTWTQMRNLLHEEDREPARIAVERAILEQSDYDIEYRVLPAQGGLRWVAAKGRAQYDPTGQVLSMLGVVQDITERKQVEQERENLLKREQVAREEAETAREQITNILESITDGFLAFDSAWCFTYVNHEGSRTLGRSPAELIGKNVWEEFPELAVTSFGQLYQRAVAEGGPLEQEDYYPPFQTWFSVRAYPSATGLALYFRNINDRKQAEAEREQLLERERVAREQAEAANRIKDEFLAVLSHELRTPLNPILGWTRLLRAGNLDAQKRALALETIERNAKLQTQLIEDLLDISRILQGKLTLHVCPVDLAVTVEAAKETIRLAAEAKSIQLQTRLEPSRGHVLGDPNRLQQVVWNLLINAVKFTPAGGQVEVRLTYESGYAQITVQDTGKGISPDFLPYVFDTFRQADGTTTRQFGGLGLGLAIVRRIVELHGGTIEADSAGEASGSTFTVRLPLMLAPAVTQPGNRPIHPTINFHDLQILLVDDEADTRELITFILEQRGAKVTAVASAQEALATFRQTLPDLLLSDIGMPGMDGYHLIQQIRALQPAQGGEIPAIALSAYTGELNQQQALQAGFQTHLAKPVELENLVQAIGELMAPTFKAANLRLS